MCQVCGLWVYDTDTSQSSVQCSVSDHKLPSRVHEVATISDTDTEVETLLLSLPPFKALVSFVQLLGARALLSWRPTSGCLSFGLNVKRLDWLWTQGPIHHLHSFPNPLALFEWGGETCPLITHALIPISCLNKLYAFLRKHIFYCHQHHINNLNSTYFID